MLERIFFCVYRVGHTLVSISIYKTLRKSILGIAENAEIMCSVKCSTQSIFQRTTPERRFFACSSERRHWPNGLDNVLAVENTKRHNVFAAILWASLPAMLRQNSSSHLACGTISAHLHICTEKRASKRVSGGVPYNISAAQNTEKSEYSLPFYGFKNTPIPLPKFRLGADNFAGCPSRGRL